MVRLGRGLGGLVSGLPGRRLGTLCRRPVGVLALVVFMVMVVLVSMASSVI